MGLGLLCQLYRNRAVVPRGAAALPGLAAPAAQCSQGPSRSQLHPGRAQDVNGLVCKRTDGEFAVFLQGLQGCDRQKQDEMSPRACRDPQAPPPDHAPYSPLQISKSMSLLWSRRGRAASPRHKAASDPLLPSALPAAQPPALPVGLHALPPQQVTPGKKVLWGRAAQRGGGSPMNLTAASRTGAWASRRYSRLCPTYSSALLLSCASYREKCVWARCRASPAGWSKPSSSTPRC